MNTSLFLQVYKNKVLNTIINNYIRYLHLKKYKHAKKLSWNDLTPELLSQYGYIDQFKKLDSYNILTCGKYAARNGHIHILKYICERNQLDNSVTLQFFTSSLRGGNIPIIEYIYILLDKNYHNSIKDYLEYTAIGGVDACKWVVNHFKNAKTGCHQSRFYENAALYGSLDTLKWGIHFLNSGSLKKDDGIRLWEKVIERKNISLLEFMKDHKQLKSLFDSRKFILLAIKYRNIDVLEWVFSKNDDSLSLDDSNELYTHLVQYGSIKAINLCTEKFDCDNNNNNIAEWFFKKCKQHGFNAIDGAVYYKNHKIIIWLYEQTNFQSTLNPLGNRPSLGVIKWFTENNRPESIPTEQLRRFTNDSDISIIDYIIRNRTEQFPNIPEVKRLILLHSNSTELLDMLPTGDVPLSEYDLNYSVIKNRI